MEVQDGLKKTRRSDLGLDTKRYAAFWTWKHTVVSLLLTEVAEQCRAATDLKKTLCYLFWFFFQSPPEHMIWYATERNLQYSSTHQQLHDLWPCRSVETTSGVQRDAGRLRVLRCGTTLQTANYGNTMVDNNSGAATVAGVQMKERFGSEKREQREWMWIGGDPVLKQQLLSQLDAGGQEHLPGNSKQDIVTPKVAAFESDRWWWTNLRFVSTCKRRFPLVSTSGNGWKRCF